MQNRCLTMARGLLMLSISLFVGTSAAAQALYITNVDASYINATAYSPDYQTLFLCSGNAISIYDINADTVSRLDWYDLGTEMNITGALSWSTDTLLLFDGVDYIVFNIALGQVEGEKAIWGGLPVSWNDSISGVVRWSSEEVMFFHRNEYVLYSFVEGNYLQYDYYDLWEGWPAELQVAVNAAFNIEGSIYFLLGGAIVRYDILEQVFYAPTAIGFASADE